MIRKLSSLCILMFSLLIVRGQSFNNPILSGFYPDPSICRAGDDYYIVASSFAYYPGLPLFHSKDLLNWKQIGYALDRPEQLNLDSAGTSAGLYAPAISFHNGTFYIVCTEVTRLGNFVITAKDPKGPWSDPVRLPQVNGIDPSLFFDNNGKSYIVFNSIPPNNVSLHNGHRTIRMFEFDAQNLKVIGEEKLLINGGTDMAKKPVWIEAPHIINKDGWYYLICAEGGTGYNHSEVVFRSKSPEGPFVSYENNPILTQRHLDKNRKNPITTAGHADFVQAKDGKWWGIFLACRPYEDDFYNTGRETFMAPVVWTNGWPEFALGGEEIKYSYPIDAVVDKSIEPVNGNFVIRDEFNSSKLHHRYRFLRTVRDTWHDFTTNPGALTMKVRPATVREKSNPSFIGAHQSHLKGHAAVAMKFKPASPDEKAGLLLFQNERTFYYLCKTMIGGKQAIGLYKGDSLVTSIPFNSDDVQFKIEANNDKYSFFYSAGKKQQWKPVKENIDAKPLSTKAAQGFVGCLYAMYATSGGKPSTNTASFDWFEIKSDDDVYKKQGQ